jgi:Flp pilus assembly protein TadG
MAAVRNIRSERGQTAVEFAFVLPLLAVLVLAVIQLGIAFNNYQTVTDAARVGARKAILIRLGGSSTTDAQLAARSAASDLDLSKFDVQVTAADWNAAGTDVTVVAKYPYQIDLLGWVVASGNLTSTVKERLE